MLKNKRVAQSNISISESVYVMRWRSQIPAFPPGLRMLHSDDGGGGGTVAASRISSRHRKADRRNENNSDINPRRGTTGTSGSQTLLFLASPSPPPDPFPRPAICT
ncbi:hypothetical protein GWI33_019517 [Rhynchophorus ferrugineus]|uniref:Uncharacterized protein n=1 Tax=Rhynchophorus ferrugineus TaxID=354439 RepID=A0A834HY60_RHYFE|nr:hypothetical protein GWI33_019517 [Rhynchophorus ferrugineus]